MQPSIQFRTPSANLRRYFAQLSLALVAACLPGGSSAEAGVIPWTYNAIFGYGPIFQNRAYAPAYGAPYYAPAAYPVSGFDAGPNYGAVSSYYGPVAYPTAGYASMGWGNPCCDCNPCCNPCNPCCPGGCATGNCAGGNCPGGNCGASYTPSNVDPNVGPQPTPSNDPPQTFRKDPPVDEFVPSRPGERDNAQPNTRPMGPGAPMNPNAPANSEPRDWFPSNNNPANSTPPNSTVPVPVRPNPNPSATPVNPDDEVFPSTSAPQPLEIEPSPVAHLSPMRNRVTMNAGYQTPRLARSQPAPVILDASGSSRLAQK